MSVRPSCRISLILTLLSVLFAASQPLVLAAQGPGGGVQGTVVDASGKPVDQALVRLQPSGSSSPVETRTNAAGVFSFAAVPSGPYRINASKAEVQSISETVDGSSPPPGQPVRLVLKANAKTAQTMEFADQPNFSVAGVTDWTAVGGHGSDATLRTSEDLARETAALKNAQPGDKPALNSATAARHRQFAEDYEKAGDSLAAVHEYEQAVRLDPSEQNYFSWGSELLLHRAIWQAAEVFRQGNRAYPTSARMLTGLGTALFAVDRYVEAAESLCAASDLQPAEWVPYSFMGRVSIASAEPLPCVEPRLARFAQQHPQNATADYLYAMALLKRLDHASSPELQPVRALLEKAVASDPRCAEAWLRLGILAAGDHHMQEAMRDYQKAIDADPQLGEAHYRLGLAYDRSGLKSEAQQEFRSHDDIEARQAAAVEKQRKDVKQFLVVLESLPASASTH